MKILSTEEIRPTRTAAAAVVAVIVTLVPWLAADAGVLACRAEAQVVIEARIIEMTGSASTRDRLMDILLRCPKAGDTQGQPAAVQANIDLTLDANIANNRNFDAPLGNAGPLVVVGRSNITDAIMIINENTMGGPFATPNYLTGPGGAGLSPQYGLLTGSKTLTWSGVYLPVPGVAGNPDVTTIRITNVRANLGRPVVPIGAKLTMRSPGYRVTENGLEWDAFALAALPTNPPLDVGFPSAPASTALKIYPVVSPSTSGLGSGSVRLDLKYTNLPQGKEWVPSITYVFKDKSPYAYNIQAFDVATTGLPNVTPELPQQPRYQIPYGQTQSPYGAPYYPNPYDYEQRERQYDPWAAGVPLNRPDIAPWTVPPVVPWEIPPWTVPGTNPWSHRR